MSILLVRHGRTTANAEGLLLGRLDPPLDETGVRQAAAAASLLAAAERRPTRLVSSPLTRTRQTAAAIGEALGLEVELDDRWLELDYGELDGVPLADVPAETWATWRTDPEFCPAGGECLSALGRRVRAACDELAEEVAEADVVVVSHVSPIKAAVAWALESGDLVAWRLFVAPGSVSRIDVGRNGPSLALFNQIPV
jgi:broad specificity phosphatase PhoE